MRPLAMSCNTRESVGVRFGRLGERSNDLSGHSPDARQGKDDPDETGNNEEKDVFDRGDVDGRILWVQRAMEMVLHFENEETTCR